MPAHVFQLISAIRSLALSIAVLLVLSGCGADSSGDETTAASGGEVNETATETETETETEEETAAAQELIFVSSSKPAIRVQGSGGNTSSTLTFRVMSNETPVPDATVSFSLSTATAVRGVKFSEGRTTGVTNAEGEVQTEVVSGAVPGPVIVFMSLDGSSLSAVASAGLAVAGGPAVAGNFSLGLDIYNPPAYGHTGIEISVGAALTDQYGHSVPDGTVVSFTAESGDIGEFCETVGGRCNVPWSSRSADQSDEAIFTTIMAYAQGAEEYLDTGSVRGLYDDADTFTDIGDAYRNDVALNNNEANLLDGNAFNQAQADASVFIIDGNSGANHVVDEAGDGKYNGPDCASTATNCSDTRTEVTLSRSVVFVLSSTATPIPTGLPASIVLADNESSSTFTVTISDRNGNALPCETTVSASTTGVGSAEMLGGDSVGCNTTSPHTASFSVSGGVDAGTGTLTFTVDMPNTNSYSFLIPLQQLAGEP